MRSKNELHCVLKFHSAIYQENPEYFWRVLNQSKKAAESCSAIKKTADFLQIAVLRNESVELQEFISEEIENLCAKKPECFKNSLQLLDKQTRVAVRERLKNPLYYNVEELSCMTLENKHPPVKP